MHVKKTEATIAQNFSWIGFSALVLSAVSMAASVIFVRFADVHPIVSAFYRAAFALPMIITIAYFKKADIWIFFSKKIDFKAQMPVFLAGVFFAGDLFFWHLAIMNTNVANATFFATLAPIAVLFLSVPLLNETVTKQAWIGLCICVIGGMFLISSTYYFAPHQLIGDLFGLITAVFFGVYTLMLRKARRHVGAIALSFNSTLVTSIVLGGAALIVIVFFNGKAIPEQNIGWLYLFCLAFVSQIAGQALYGYALGLLSAAFSSLVIFLEGVTAAILGWLFVNETLTFLQVIGIVIIIIGVEYSRRYANQKN